MKLLTLLLVLPLAATLSAQVNPPPAPPVRNQRPATPPRNSRPVIPDPDLMDGSSFQPEKRPDYGMLSEIEMGEKEGGDSALVSPDSGAGDPGAQPPEAGGPAGASPREQAGGSAEKIAGGPQAEAQGSQAAKLEAPEGAAAAGQDVARPRDLQIGDATLQIEVAKTSSLEVVGTQSTDTQQYEKKIPSGQQSDNRNQGVERGQVIPQGL